MRLSAARECALVLLAVVVVLLPISAFAGADEAVTDAQKAQLEELRGQIADQIQLQAYDLLDELVYGWNEQPVFANATPVVLAGVSVPVGFGSGLEALIENHFAGLIIQNPRSKVQLAHCPQCTALIVHSGAKGTVVSRGVDQPEALVQAGAATSSHHALFLDFEAEGAALVLRARITSLEPNLPIVYARTLSTSTSTPALLREPTRLKSGPDARQEYLEALQGRGVFILPLRIGVRSYAQPDQNNPDVTLRPTPMVWLQLGAEAAFTQARAWTGSASIGFSWTPELQTSFQAQGRISRLLSGNTTSLTRPDVYGFVGASVIYVRGTGAQAFMTKVPTSQEILQGATGVSSPEITFAAFQIGVEMRVKNRIGIGLYLEDAPALNDSPNVGKYLDFGILQFHDFGAEVSFCF